MKVRATVGGVTLGLLLCSAAVGPPPLEAQGPDGRWPLQPRSPVNRIIAPFLEGWYENEDGSISFSFGYNNLNGSDTVYIPVGEKNFIEPAQYNGMQPEVFLPGKHRGLFAITVPPSERDINIWWTLENPNGEITKVPGRVSTGVAYQLDWNPRPHGSVPPLVSLYGSEEGRGPPGTMAERTLTATVGEPLELQVTTREVSERDEDDFRFREDLPVRVVWYVHQAPEGAHVEWTRHETTPVPEEPEGRGGGQFFGRGRPGPNSILQEGEGGDGLARVYATFDTPGEYLLLVQADNFRAPDSSSGDQCCWSNGYVRVNVTE